MPDIVIASNGRKLLVEIAVTHFVDRTKTNKIKKLGISAIEIDIHDLKNLFDKEELKRCLLSGIERKKWIFNVKADAAEKKVSEDMARFAVTRKRVEGFGHERLHGGRVYGCPKKCNLTRNKTPYAIPLDNCAYCEYHFCGKRVNYDDPIFCTGASKVTSYKEFLDFINKGH